MASLIYCVLICSYMWSELKSTAINPDAVSYLDENGDLKTANNAKQIIGQVLNRYEVKDLLNGWWYVNETIPSGGMIKIIKGADVKVILMDNSEWTVTRIYGDGNAALLIYAQSTGPNAGKLTVKGGVIDWPGISIKTLIINGGVINALGGVNASGINGTGGSITINGGTVVAITGTNGSGIGGGINGAGGTVIINGGWVEASGGINGSGIGGGNNGNGGSVTVNGGTVVATGGSLGSGIGGGNGKRGGSVTVKGGTVTVQGGARASGIGGGERGAGYTVVITGGSVKASAGEDVDSGIGGGFGSTSNGVIRDNSTNSIYLNTISTWPPTAKAPVTEAVIDGESSYGLKGVFTDDEGKLYFYLPPRESTEVAGFKVGGVEYKGYAENGTDVIQLVTCANLAREDGEPLGCPQSAALLKRPWALALIVAVIVWLM